MKRVHLPFEQHRSVMDLRKPLDPSGRSDNQINIDTAHIRLFGMSF